MRDIDIRRVLRAEVARLHKAELDTVVFDELGLCQGVARVDLAAINGSVHGYEIKSERDTLARLQGQVDVYSRALDFVTVVLAPTHVKKATAAVPTWWGIWTAITRNGVVQLERERPNLRNPMIEPFAMVQLLWRGEALQALEARGLAVGMRSKPRRQLWQRLSSELEPQEVGEIVRAQLKRRDWRASSLQA